MLVFIYLVSMCYACIALDRGLRPTPMPNDQVMLTKNETTTLSETISLGREETGQPPLAEPTPTSGGQPPLANNLTTTPLPGPTPPPTISGKQPPTETPPWRQPLSPGRQGAGGLLNQTGACSDLYENCQEWASKEECVKNPFWMKPNCQQSCYSCGMTVKDVNKPPARPGCENMADLCQFWQSLGECENNDVWMMQNCKLSCKSC